MNLSPDTQILIVGASGLLGAGLARTLAQRGLRARCLVRSTSDRGRLAGHVAEADIVTGDVLDPASIEPYFRGIDLCFHVSGTVDMGRPRAQVDRLIAGGGRTVLEHCRRHGVGKVVAVSTGETIGVCRRPGDACDETDHSRQSTVPSATSIGNALAPPKERCIGSPSPENPCT
jgi:nucleoside-diphosphate-sugar epimerase